MGKTAGAFLGVIVLPFMMITMLFAAGGTESRDAAATHIRERELVPSTSTGHPEGFDDWAWTSYVTGSEQAREQVPSCHVRPQILAAIAEVESHQGTLGGSTVDPITGDVFPPIYGPWLDGENGFALIEDTDQGFIDGDPESAFDRAVGPFQFIPSSWILFGGDGNNDGVADPHNMADGALAAALHLCSSHAVDFDEHPDLLRSALFDYNNSSSYVDKVMQLTGVFDDRTPNFDLGEDAPAVGDYALPLPVGSLDADKLGRPHHTYPAIDLGVPVGTDLYAVTGGTVTDVQPDLGRCGGTIVLEGNDGWQYTMCHLSQISIAAGAQVEPGQFLGRTGGQPGAPGAGRSTGPHLHLSMRRRGVSHCPQTLLISIYFGQPINPESTPTQGCIS